MIIIINFHSWTSQAQMHYWMSGISKIYHHHLKKKNSDEPKLQQKDTSQGCLREYGFRQLAFNSLETANLFVCLFVCFFLKYIYYCSVPSIVNFLFHHGFRILYSPRSTPFLFQNFTKIQQKMGTWDLSNKRLKIYLFRNLILT